MGETVEQSSFLTLLLSGVLGMLILAFSLVIFFVIYQRRLLQQQRLRREEEKLHQKALLIAAVDEREKERRRIAADLHDEIGSKLSAVRLFIGQLSLSDDKPNNQELKDDSLEVLGNILNNARRITHDLFPPELEKFGLFAAAEDLSDRIDRGGKLKVVCKVAVDETGASKALLPARINRKTELALYRVLQEMMNNTLKHANASEVIISFRRQEDDLYFTYQDNGVGLQTNELKPGLGLKNIETRVILVGGTLVFDSQPGMGLKLDVVVPLGHWKKS